MSLELVAPDREVPNEDERDTRLDERLEKLSTLVECLKEDLVDTCGILKALLDYFEIDRMELEFFKTTGRLRSYPPKSSITYQEVVKAEQLKAAEGVELLGVKDQLAEREKDVDNAIEQLDAMISGIVKLNPEYDNC